MSDVLNPVKRVDLRGGGCVQVKELNWRAGLEFLKLLSAHAAKMFNAKGEFEFTMGQLTELIGETGNLAQYLVKESTGLDDETIRALSLSETLDVLDAALELNLSEELLAKGKKLAGRVRGVLGVKGAAAVSVPPSIS